MIAGMDKLARRLAGECHRDARIFRCGFIMAILAAWACVYGGLTGWAIALTCIGVFMGFIAAILRHDARALDKLADLYEKEGEP